jgi:hypothetical protein
MACQKAIRFYGFAEARLGFLKVKNSISFSPVKPYDYWMDEINKDIRRRKV